MEKEPLDKDEVIQPIKKSSKIKKDIHKGSWIKSIIKEGKWYLVASVATKALGFFLIPIYTKHLSPADYGVLGTLITITELLPVILSLSIDVAFARFFHDYKDDDSKLTSLYSSVFWFVTIFGSSMLVLFLFSTYFWLEELLTVPVYPFAFLAFIPAIFAQLNQLGVRFLRQSLQARTASIITVLSAIVNMGLSTILLVEFDMGIEGRLWGIGAAVLMNFIFLTTMFIRSGMLKWTFSKKFLLECLYYSMPMILMTSSNWINSVSDRLVVAKYVDTAAVGLYALAFQFAIIVDIIGTAITEVLMPMSMSGLIHDKENTKKKLSEYAAFMWVFMIFLNVGVLLFSKDVILFMANERYLAAYVAIPILASRKVFGMQYRFFAVLISYHKKTSYFTYTSITVALFNLALNFMFVPIYGYLAAVWSTFACSVLYAAIIIVLGLRLEKVVIQWKKYVLSTALYAVVIFLHLTFDFSFLSRVLLSIVATLGLFAIMDKKEVLVEYFQKK